MRLPCKQGNSVQYRGRALLFGQKGVYLKGQRSTLKRTMKVSHSIGHDRLSVRVSDGKQYASLNISRSGVRTTFKAFPANMDQFRSLAKLMGSTFDSYMKSSKEATYGQAIEAVVEVLKASPVA